MAVFRKTDPVGIDAVVDDLQTQLETLGWTTYDNYSRAYKNKTENGIIPERYTQDGNYLEVLFNDNLNASSFFLMGDSLPVIEEGLKVNGSLSLIVQVKLDKLKPLITHRPDEEIRYSVVLALSDNTYNWEVTNITTGIDNVYSGFDVSQINYTDMSEFHVFKLDLNGYYIVKC